MLSMIIQPRHSFLRRIMLLLSAQILLTFPRRDHRLNFCLIFVTSGKCEIALFGYYVDHLKQLMAKVDEGLHMLDMQFTKVKIFSENGSPQNVVNTTRIMINPDISEAAEFKKGNKVYPIFMNQDLVKLS
ncbi:hypothetical protein MTR_5g084280 [Medicago truncatula]|uniref:Uncharacterized protein n=1 Tax=Medicago truncatula TaxID=3880 RepID=G7KH60_MEDTR|nr:hypothetical protein MTR_5g084280 [Medicago truncatula]